MIARRDSSEASSWKRVESFPERLPRLEVEELTAAVAGEPDDAEVRISAQMLRRLLAAHEPPETRAGARIRDEERRVTYNVTLHREGGDVRLRTVEVVPDEDTDNPNVYRVPVQLLTTLAAEVIANADAGYQITGVRAVADNARKPSASELADLAGIGGAGWTRHMIAEEFDRSLGTVDQWLRRARQELPDRFPKRSRGPKPHTPDPK